MSRGLVAWAVLAVLAFPAGTKAALQEDLMEQAGVDLLRNEPVPSVRLAGLAAMGLAVPDEATELDAYDFGRSISGLLEDADGWTIDSWMSDDRLSLEQSQRSFERNQGRSGARIVRRGANLALGADVQWSSFESPNADWVKGKVGGPVIAGILNQRVGPAILGVRLGLQSEEESKDSRDFFAISHSQERTIGQVGAQAGYAGLVFGGTWDFERGDIEGKSEDPARFHEDDYTWTRPVDRFGLFVLLPRRGPLEGGVRISTIDRKGSEQVKISWSDRSPRNPSRTDFRLAATTFEEEESDFQFATRWRFHARPGTILGFEAGYRNRDQTVVEGVNFKGSLLRSDTSESLVSAGLGLSHRMFGDRVVAVAEGRAWTNDRDYATDGAEATATARWARAGLGLEFFAAPAVVLRGAVFTQSEDLDIDAPLTLNTTRGVTGGISWLPYGGLVQIHAALQYQKIDREENAAVDVEAGDGLGFALGMRFLP